MVAVFPTVYVCRLFPETLWPTQVRACVYVRVFCYACLVRASVYVYACLCLPVCYRLRLSVEVCVSVAVLLSTSDWLSALPSFWLCPRYLCLNLCRAAVLTLSRQQVTACRVRSSRSKASGGVRRREDRLAAAITPNSTLSTCSRCVHVSACLCR